MNCFISHPPTDRRIETLLFDDLWSIQEYENCPKLFIYRNGKFVGVTENGLIPLELIEKHSIENDCIHLV